MNPTEKMKPREKALTLSDVAKSSERTVSRRSLLGLIGIGAGVGAVALFGPARPVGAAVIKRNTGDAPLLSTGEDPKKNSKKEKSLKGKSPKDNTSKP
jgi:hypothetical protein